MGICEGAPDRYCGHVLEPEDGEAGDVWHKVMGNAVCLREPKYDRMCVWHADTDEKTAEELVEARLTPDDVPWETEYVREHLSGAIFRGIEFPMGFSFGGCVLVHAEFPEATLLGTEFPNASLRGAEFPDAYLYQADFPDASIRYAEFLNASLYETEFPNASLRNAKFPNAYIRDAQFPEADLKGAQFPGTTLNKAQFPDANLNSAKFPRVTLRGAEFPNASLRNAKFPDATLRNAKFPDATLRNAKFPDATLAEAEFPRTNLAEAEFPRTNLAEAEFPRTNLAEAEFSETNLRGTTLTEANLCDAEFSDANLRDATFRPAYARVLASEDDTATDPLGASLEDAQFEDGTDLRGANLSGARLYQTAFRDVRINDETRFGIDDENSYGKACRYEYDERTGVSINDDTSRLEAAAWTYRRLESLFEANAMDERARDAHIRKQEAQRAYHAEQLADDEWVEDRKFPPDSWLKSFGQYSVATLNWHLHRHGESLRRLLGMSGLLIFLCGFIYAGAGVARSNPETTYRITLADLADPGAMLVDLLNGWYFSVITFSTIGYGDFYPVSPVSRLLVGIESLAGALLIALFVFVIGRRVAR
mgnify:CR=1 FL=1